MDSLIEDYFAGGLMIGLGFIGFFCNALIFISLYKSFRSPTFSSFSVLCCFRSLSNCGTLLSFILYSGPVAFLWGGYPYGPEIVGRKFGHLTTLTYKSVVYVHLAIAFNRFIATFFTFKYPLIFGRRGTFIILGRLCFITSLHCIPQFLGRRRNEEGIDCILIQIIVDTHSSTITLMDYLDTPCSSLLGGPLLFYPSYSVFLGSITLNMVIFIKLSYHTLRHSNEMGSQAKERHRKNVRCFIQSFLQELMYIFEAFSPSNKSSSRSILRFCFLFSLMGINPCVGWIDRRHLPWGDSSSSFLSFNEKNGESVVRSLKDCDYNEEFEYTDGMSPSYPPFFTSFKCAMGVSTCVYFSR